MDPDDRSMTRPYPTNLQHDGDGPDRNLTQDEEELVARLNADDLAAIDAVLVGAARNRWRKVAMLVATALSELEETYPLLPDVYYGRRVRQLVEKGVFDKQGNLARMRFSEVRLVQVPSSRS